jgi:YidC/Oxa1 family membrane protein insertase
MVMMLVMVGVIFGLQWWRAKHNPDTAAPSAPAAVTQPAGAPPPAVAQSLTPATPGASSVPAVQAAAETTTVVENALYKITFSNRGGEVTSWVLKRYKDKDGQPLDVVHQGASNLYGYPLSLYTYDPGLTKALASGLYVASATGTMQAPATVEFKYAAGNVSVTKSFSFGADYVIHADTQVLRDGAPVAADLAWPAGFGDMETVQAYAGATLDTSSSDKTDHEAFKKVIGGATLQGPFDFGGVTDQYFGAIFLPDHVDDATLVTLNNQIDVKDLPRGGSWVHGGTHGPPVAAKGVTLVPVIGAALGSKAGHVATRLFVGPKDYTLLKGIKTTTGDSLVSVIDFGFWGYISQGLFLGLRAVHSWIAPAVTGPHDFSWGWAIVIFTVLLNLVLLPLRVTGMKGMLKMQRIQPQIDAIKAKHGNPGATDPKAAAMNAEVMELQKKEGVSMFGGCIPTLIQFPLLFAFFTMMTRVVELRQAHWLWLHDLSAADPYKILPIVMVVTSFLVQFYTPNPGVDPQQARMMAFMMPAFSGYMTWNYASGLALYWNVGNFIMILQQMVMNRTKLGMEIRELQKKRMAKKIAGQTTGKTIQGKR